MKENKTKEIIELIKSSSFTIEDINEIENELYNKNPLKHNPVSRVQFIDIDKIEPNDYNPNAVAKNEMKL